MHHAGTNGAVKSPGPVGPGSILNGVVDTARSLRRAFNRFSHSDLTAPLIRRYNLKESCFKGESHMTSSDKKAVENIMELMKSAIEWKAEAESLRRENTFLKELLLQKGPLKQDATST